MIAPLTASPYQVGDSMGEVPLDHADLLLDPAGTFTINDVQKASGWAPVSSPLSAGYQSGATWLRFQVENPTANRMELFVSLRWTALDSAHLFRRAGGAWVVKQSGDQIPYYRWNVLSYHPSFRVNLEPGQREQIYIRLQSTSILNFPISLYDRKTFRADDRRTGSFAWVLIGAGSMLFLLAGFLALLTRQPGYLLYSAYTMLLALGLFATYGSALEILWPSALDWQNKAVLVLLPAARCLSILFIYFVAREVFDHLASRIAAAVFVLACCAVAAGPLLGIAYGRLITLYSGLALAVCLWLPLAIGRAALRGSRAAGLLLLFWSPSLLARIPAALFYLDMLPYSFWTVYGWILFLPLDFPLLLLLARPEPQSGPYARSRIGNLDRDALLKRLVALLDDTDVTSNPDLRMPDVSRMLGIPPYQLSELINHQVKKPFRVLLNEYRIRHAQFLLDTTDTPIADAVRRAGFRSRSPFNQAFKKYTGLSPAAYRAQARPPSRTCNNSRH